ncbi:hypothetical protein O0L34_g8861 [Tuta absoluta]|nr:hypothetical protein O0L34_g8861 [Tuta absoluta]
MRMEWCSNETTGSRVSYASKDSHRWGAGQAGSGQEVVARWRGGAVVRWCGGAGAGSYVIPLQRHFLKVAQAPRECRPSISRYFRNSLRGATGRLAGPQEVKVRR